MQSAATAAPARRRPQRPKRTPIDTDEYVLDLDAEILNREDADVKEEANDPEAALAAASFFVPAEGESLTEAPKKKRGRPRKHPLPPPADSSQAPVAKRPRGRPRGSGKHQRAALARSLSMSGSGSLTSSDIDPMAPQTGDQIRTPPPMLANGLGAEELTPVSDALDANRTPPQAFHDRRRRRKGTIPSRGV